MSGLVRIRAAIDKTLARVLVLLLALLVIDVLWQVFSRLVLRAPSSFTDELARFLFIWIGLLGAAYAAGQGLHLAIDLWPRRASPALANKLGQLTRGAICAFAVFVMVVGGARLVAIALRLNQRSPTLEVPLGWIYLAVPLSGLLLVFYALTPSSRNDAAAPERP